MSKQFNEKNKALALQCAIDVNYHGKRLLTRKKDIACTIIEELDLSISSESMIKYLDENKPVKATAAKRQKAELEPLVPTFNGSDTERDSLLPVLPCGRYIISSAQNNTMPHEALKTLIAQADKLSAGLLLLPIKYTTTLEQRERKEPSYIEAVQPYLLTENCFIGSRKGVRLAVTASILPTAKQPINTAKTLNTGEAVTIVASPKAQTLTLPRPKGGDHRWLYTSRTITKRHYTDSRAGDEAEQDHMFGAIYLEVFEDGTIYHHEMIAQESTGEIFHPELSDSDQVVGLVAGDLHCEKMCPDSFNRLKAQVIEFQPQIVVTHDTLDFMSRNHHNRNSGRFLYQMGSRTVLDDLRTAIEHLNALAELTPELFVVASNHDDALSQWLDCPFYKADQDPLNAKTYYYLKFCILDHIDIGHDSLNVFDLACKELSDQVGELADNVTFGYLDEQKKVIRVEVGQHGHNGSGGARGSAKTFKNYRMPIITGHTHSPQRDGLQLTVGVTGSLEMGYNKGGSAWDRANALILESGLTLLIPTYAINEPQY